MAIYMCRVQTISRGAGRSATAAAAYRAGERITDAREKKTHDYRKKRDVESAAIFLPHGVTAPRPMREELWNAAEAAERRKDATVAREALVALPHELDERARTTLARSFGRWLADTYGVAVDVCVHRPHADKRENAGDPRNYQAHILFTTRKITPDGQLGAKTRILDQKQTGRDEIRHIRAQWQIMCNRALERAGRPERIDCRTLKAQGINRAAQVTLGPAAAALERQGIKTKKGDYNRRLVADQQAPAPPATERADEPRTSAASYQPKPPAAAPKPDPIAPSADYYARKAARLAAAQAAPAQPKPEPEEQPRPQEKPSAYKADNPQADNQPKKDEKMDIYEQRRRAHEEAMRKAGVYKRAEKNQGKGFEK